MVHFPERIRLPRDAYANPNAVFHVVINAHPELRSFRRPVCESLWKAVLDVSTRGEAELIAASLMPDHLHLLVKPATSNLLDWLNSWKSWTTRLSWNAGHKGPLWQPGMWDRTIRSEEDLHTVVQYILDNPVRANLVETAANWPHNFRAPLE